MFIQINGSFYWSVFGLFALLQIGALAFFYYTQYSNKKLLEETSVPENKPIYESRAYYVNILNIFLTILTLSSYGVGIYLFNLYKILVPLNLMFLSIGSSVATMSIGFFSLYIIATQFPNN